MKIKGYFRDKIEFEKDLDINENFKIAEDDKDLISIITKYIEENISESELKSIDSALIMIEKVCVECVIVYGKIIESMII